MPLLPPVLVSELALLDEGSGLTDIPSAASAWAEAWWSYASGMTYLNPATVAASKLLAVPAFMAVIAPGLAPGPPITFMLALEGAMRAGWGTLSTPASLIPPVVSIIPSPVPFAPIGMQIVPVGMASPSKMGVRTMLASLIHAWTVTHITVASIPSGTVGPIL